ncbi:hypothetical protein LOAG_12087 [Loa loa]|uniref:Uncharacterized protein n=1 Tax=Loa loa TaxID=7209 RepID=A0A1S0TLV9_LOALO|nr:hypothetical protein LOAG_12087 [Loa loa]EFO16421.1 hypothetical protein LOAG_12087 [Loa loa]
MRCHQIRRCQVKRTGGEGNGDRLNDLGWEAQVTRKEHYCADDSGDNNVGIETTSSFTRPMQFVPLAIQFALNKLDQTHSKGEVYNNVKNVSKKSSLILVGDKSIEQVFKLNTTPFKQTNFFPALHLKSA